MWSEQPDGLPEISRGLRRAATIPVNEQRTVPWRGASGRRWGGRFCHPYRVREISDVNRGCQPRGRLQPPANFSQPFRLPKASSRNQPHRWGEPRFGYWEEGSPAVLAPCRGRSVASPIRRATRKFVSIVFITPQLLKQLSQQRADSTT